MEIINYKAIDKINGKKVELIVKETSLKPNNISTLINKLNKAGFNLGSGHDGASIEKNKKEYIMILIPFYGAPSQKVTFKQTKSTNDK